MAHGSGLDAQLGIGSETTWGTRATPTTFLPFLSESLQLTPTYLDSEPIQSGLMVRPQGLHKQTGRSVEGSIELEFYDRSMGKILNMLHGKTVTPTTPDGATNSRLFTHEIGEDSPVGKGLTIQVGRPDSSGTVRPFDYIGCKIAEFALSIEQGGAAALSLSIDGKDELTDQSLATPTYAAVQPYTFNLWEIKVDNSEIENVASLTLTIPLNFKTDRRFLGGGGTKAEQLANGRSNITVSAELEFASDADHARFKADAAVALTASAVGSEIESGFDYETTVEIASCKQISSGPAVAGPDVISQSVEFEVLGNGSDAPVVISQQTDDTAL